MEQQRRQGLAVATMLGRHWTQPDVTDTALASIPAVLRDTLRAAISSGQTSAAAAEW